MSTNPQPTPLFLCPVCMGLNHSELFPCLMTLNEILRPNSLPVVFSGWHTSSALAVLLRPHSGWCQEACVFWGGHSPETSRYSKLAQHFLCLGTCSNLSLSKCCTTFQQHLLQCFVSLAVISRWYASCVYSVFHQRFTLLFLLKDHWETKDWNLHRATAAWHCVLWW